MNTTRQYHPWISPQLFWVLVAFFTLGLILQLCTYQPGREEQMRQAATLRTLVCGDGYDPLPPNVYEVAVIVPSGDGCLTHWQVRPSTARWSFGFKTDREITGSRSYDTGKIEPFSDSPILRAEVAGYVTGYRFKTQSQSYVVHFFFQ
jgi:hypothetical protein